MPRPESVAIPVDKNATPVPTGPIRDRVEGGLEQAGDRFAVKVGLDTEKEVRLDHRTADVGQDVLAADGLEGFLGPIESRSVTGGSEKRAEDGRAGGGDGVVRFDLAVRGHQVFGSADAEAADERILDDLGRDPESLFDVL